MGASIEFSPEYLGLLKKMLKVFNDLPDRQHGLVFKLQDDPDARMVSSMSLNTLVAIRTTKEHVDFEDAEIGITSLSEFLNYANAINYPSDGSEISRVTEVSTRGKSVNSFLFSGKYGKYRMPIAGPDEFDDKYDRKVPKQRDSDPLRLVANFYLSESDLERLVKDIQMMNKADFFRLVVEDSRVKIYIKGVQGQQFSKTLDQTKTKVFDDFTTKKEDSGYYKLFPTRIFGYMSHFGCDFDVEVRHHKSRNADILTIKAFGTVKFNGKPDVDVFVFTKESVSELSTHNSDIVE